MSRKESLLSIRPILHNIIEDHSNTVELFQNTVLRPILKFQHEQLYFTFIHSSHIAKLNFTQKDNTAKQNIIVHALKSNQKLKDQIIQSILSLMTIDELEQFATQKSEYQKRILSMASQRILDEATR